jgi:ribose-phosphate pyrophosphokinase
MSELKIFSGRANPRLANDICASLHLSLGSITLGQHPDGENFCKIDDDVRGRDVFLVQPTCPPVNNNLMELLIMIDSCKRASASRITAVVPYYGYARQDRKDEGRVPITAKLVANMITRAGADRVLTMDLHAPQIQGFFDVNAHFHAKGYAPEEIVVVSPDEGSIKRAIGHSKRLGGRLAIVDKRRDNALVTIQKNIIGGPVEGKICFMFDDMISTAGSICGAAEFVRKAGAKEIHLGATHAVLCGPAIDNIRKAPIDSLCITDTIPLTDDKKLPCIEVLSVADLLAEAIRRIHHHQSLSEMFRPPETGHQK